MLTALTRKPSPSLPNCELEFVKRSEIDFPKACAQHAAYEAALARDGARVLSLPADPTLADSVFVEDPVIVLDDVAIIARPGVASRQEEVSTLAETLREFRELRFLAAPATLEGGDVLRIGRTLYVGASRRTNAAGISQLRDIVEPFGYYVIDVPVHGCLHLKTACCPLGDGSVLVNEAWIDVRPMRSLLFQDVPESEPWGANILAIGGTLLVPSSAPATCELLARCHRVETLDISEFQKAEAGLTCLSVLFDT